MSKELFVQMREIEAFELSATKKDCIEKGLNYSKMLLDEGLITKQELFAKAIRYLTFVNEVIANLKTEFNEKESFFGVEVVPTNGRQMVQFIEDPVYAGLQKQLKDREELLKVALKSDSEIYDSEGVEVPKVSVKYAKDSLAVKF